MAEQVRKALSTILKLFSWACLIVPLICLPFWGWAWILYASFILAVGFFVTVFAEMMGIHDND